MLTLDQAVQRVLEDVPLMPPERIALAAARGRVTAEAMHAVHDVPPADNSAMDGYAVCTEGLSDEAVLRVAEVVAAGAVPRVPVVPGAASRIMTGAVVPPGADAVVIQENCTALEGSVQVHQAPAPGANIRRRGDDVRRGQVLLEAGVELRPGAMGVLASQGLTRIAVRRRPRLAVVATGDELVRPGEALAQGQIYASNSVAIAALIEDAGGVALDGGIARDDPDALIACLEAAARGADAVVTTGGVSVGEFDHVRGAFGRLGGAVNFWKIAIKPGKPFAWGHIVVDGRRVPLFGLPGNPVSAVVNFLQLARPWIRSSLGLPRPFLPVVVATAGEDLRARPGRAKLIRVTLSTGAGGWVAHSTGSQSSGVLSSIAAAHGLALVPAETAHIRAGEPVRVQVIDPGFLDGSDPGYGW